MFVRIWKVELAPGKYTELEAFSEGVSLPMFRMKSGCFAAFFTRTETECAVITIWESEQEIRAMEDSTVYKQAVQQIERSGILGNTSQTEVFTLYGGFMNSKLSDLVNSN